MKLAACGVAPAPGRPARAFSRGRENGNYKADANAGGMRGNSQRALPFPQKEAAGRFDGRPACRKNPPLLAWQTVQPGQTARKFAAGGHACLPVPGNGGARRPSIFIQATTGRMGRQKGRGAFHETAAHRGKEKEATRRARIPCGCVCRLCAGPGSPCCARRGHCVESDALLQGPCRNPALQEPALPNGCEAASLASVLDYYGLQADMLDLAYGYIPRQDFYQAADGSRIGPNPETAYPGDPASLGFYCFAGALCEGANTYLQKAGSSLRAYDVTGITEAGPCRISGGRHASDCVGYNRLAAAACRLFYLAFGRDGRGLYAVCKPALPGAYRNGRDEMQNDRPLARRADSGKTGVSGHFCAGGQPCGGGALKKSTVCAKNGAHSLK